MNFHTIELKSPNQREPYGVADLSTQPGNVQLWLGTRAGNMGFGLDLTPACARELAAALTDHAAAAELAAADQEGGQQ